MREHQVRSLYGIVRDYQTTPYFDTGEFTDDTCMALAIAEPLIEAESVDIEVIADALVEWMNTDGRGIGLLDFQDEDALVQDTIVVSRITHYDPRCCWSSVAINAAIAAILNESGDPLEAAAKAARGRCDELDLAIRSAAAEDVQFMALDGENKGYTILTTQVALAALRQFESFEDEIVAVVNKGGDADTNGAVAGALLGAKVGYEELPPRWVKGLRERERIIAAADGLFELAGCRIADVANNSSLGLFSVPSALSRCELQADSSTSLGMTGTGDVVEPMP